MPSYRRRTYPQTKQQKRDLFPYFFFFFSCCCKARAEATDPVAHTHTQKETGRLFTFRFISELRCRLFSTWARCKQTQTARANSRVFHWAKHTCQLVGNVQIISFIPPVPAKVKQIFFNEIRFKFYSATSADLKLSTSVVSYLRVNFSSFKKI